MLIINISKNLEECLVLIISYSCLMFCFVITDYRKYLYKILISIPFYLRYNQFSNYYYIYFSNYFYLNKVILYLIVRNKG